MVKETKKTQVPKVKPQKARVRRLLKKRAPQIVENTKKALIFKGMRASQDIQDVLKDLSALLKPNVKQLNHKNEILPFEDTASLEFLCEKNDCSLFVMGSHSKKRPNNLVMVIFNHYFCNFYFDEFILQGRTYDFHVLDMFEFGVDEFQNINSFEGFKKFSGSKPLLVFLGEQWTSESIYGRLQNLFIDVFRGDRPDKIALKGMDHVISFTCQDGKIFIRAFNIQFLKSGTNVPNVDLHNMGPFLTLTMRRHQLASEDLWKLACKKPKKYVESAFFCLFLAQVYGFDLI